MGHHFQGSHMLLISLFDARGTYIDNYGIFIDLRKIEFY